MTAKLYTFALLVLLGLSLSGSPALLAQDPAQSAPGASQSAAPATPMTRYYMVILRRGPAWTATPTPESRKVSQGHMANIQRLTKEGVMVVAGPFEDQSGERALAGIFILRVGSMEEAKAVAQSDPAVKAGRFVYEIAPWWGPSSLRY